MTAFMNSSNHKLGSKSLELLKRLTTKAKYRCGYFWISYEAVKGNNDLSEIVTQFSMYFKTTSQSEVAKFPNITSKHKESKHSNILKVSLKQRP